MLTDRTEGGGERAADRPDGFRPDIEGLRAVAVGLVLLYHARLPGMGGGFVGVDVFFVLSGFLITGIIVRELAASGTVSLPAFYARRARRLLPAAAVALAVTVLVSALVLPPLRVGDVAGDGAAAALYAANIRFALQATDYLQAELDPSPVLHFWSLGVEEQFYLFWPALLLVAARGARALRARLGIVVAAVTGLSLALSLVLTDLAAPWAFFSLPTRAWELGLGALVALGAGRIGAGLPRWAAVAAVGAGLAAIVAAGALIRTTTPFPGVAALLPTVGTALVIAGGLRRPAPLPSRLLGLAPLRFLGRISYSLYLWHWPMLVLPAAALGTALPLRVRLLLAAATIPLAWASQRWIEEPIRRGAITGFRPARTLALAGALSLAVVVTSVGVGSIGAARTLAGDAAAAAAQVDLSGELPPPAGEPTAAPSGHAASTPSAAPSAPSTPSPPPATAPGPVPADLVPALAAARDDLPVVYADGCHVVIRDTTSGRCEFAVRGADRSVVLFGDSHAAQWFPALERIAADRGWRLVSLTKAACPAAEVAVWNSLLKRTYSECAEWRAAAVERIASARPALVVVANSSRHTLAVDGAAVPVAERPDLWAAGLATTLAGLARTAPVVVIGETPRSRVDPPVCLSAHVDDILACATPMATALDVARIAADRATAEAAGATFVDPTAWVCPSEPCPPVIGRILVYRDGHHMTATFAGALHRLLAAELPAAGQGRP